MSQKSRGSNSPGVETPIYKSRSVSRKTSPHGSEKIRKSPSKEFPGEGIYEGDLVDGKRHGKGRLINTSGFVFYDGNWEDNEKSGYGISKFEKGDCHEGDYLKGKRHGPGIFLWADGDKYCGSFENDSIHGYGRYEWADGNTFTGHWTNGRMIGEGRLHKQGEHSQGYFYDGLLHGWGKKQWADGTCCEGQFQRGLLCGYGRMYLPDHSSFEGMWKDNLCAGLGRYELRGEEKPQLIMQQESTSYGRFPSWPVSIGHLSVTWPLTTTDSEELHLDVLQYFGEVNDEDVNVGEHLETQMKSAVIKNQKSSLQHSRNNISQPYAHYYVNIPTTPARYGRVEYAIGLVYEGECRQYLPHGYGCLYNPRTFGHDTLTATVAQASACMSTEEIASILDEMAESGITTPEDMSELMLLAAMERIPPQEFRKHIHRFLSIEVILWRRGGSYVGKFNAGELQIGEGCLTLCNGQVFQDI